MALYPYRASLLEHPSIIDRYWGEGWIGLINCMSFCVRIPIHDLFHHDFDIGWLLRLFWPNFICLKILFTRDLIYCHSKVANPLKRILICLCIPLAWDHAPHAIWIPLGDMGQVIDRLFEHAFSWLMATRARTENRQGGKQLLGRNGHETGITINKERPWLEEFVILVMWKIVEEVITQIEHIFYF